jgi:hypothetical protein
MSFEITQVEGTVDQIKIDLSEPSHHEREEQVVTVVKQAISDVASSLGGYLSVSCSGNINPVSGETGDLIQIYITSLPVPQSAQTPPVETPKVQTGESTPVTEESPQPQSVMTPENQEPVQQETAPSEPPVETPLVIQENPTSTQPSTAPEIPAEKSPEVSSEAPAPAVEPTSAT